MSTALVPAPADTVSLFDAAPPAHIIDLAADVASRFADIVKQQRLSLRIGRSEHILIEGWQTVGALVGVFTDKDGGVTELPWPTVSPPGERPADPGREPPRAAPSWPEWESKWHALTQWEQRRALHDARAEGLAFGYTASLRAIHRGATVGWAEGMCDRQEDNWTTKANHQLRSQAQTRAQSRALAAPLRWIVGMSGYATTPVEDMPAAGDSELVVELRGQVSILQAQLAEAQVPVALSILDLGDQEELVRSLEATWPERDAMAFVTALEHRFPDGIPEPAGVALRAWAWFQGETLGQPTEAPQTGAESASAPSTSETAPDDPQGPAS